MFWDNDKLQKKLKLPTRERALPGRSARMPVAARHTVLTNPMTPPYPPDAEAIVVAMGCFWGAEKKFFTLPRGVWTTAVGYAGGFTPNPTYREVCSGETGHTEVVLVVHQPALLSTDDVLRTFWESHDPTQGMRQGNDVGTQYRSAVYCTTDAQLERARASRDVYQRLLTAKGFGPITTELAKIDRPLDDFFFFAEDDHQQYLDKNPDGYCGLGGTGVSCPIGVGVAAR